jgi:hypothetical protein
MSARIATVVTVERDNDGPPTLDVRVDSAGDSNTTDHFDSAGVDAPPLPGDSVLLVQQDGEGEEAVSGYHDPKNAGVAEPGERRTYARDAEGTLVCEVWLKKDGSVHIEAHETARVFVKTPGPVIIDSPDIRLGDEESSRAIACVGDMVAGSIKALSAAPGSPILPAAGAPTATGGVPFVGQIISGSPRAKAK